jgi:exosome complex RNA-binding protein Rrp42 (RNase PH superfamily)
MAALFSSAELSYSTNPLIATSKSSLRSDARQPLAYRDIILQTSIAQPAIGSARIIVDSLAGSTEICAGVRGEVEDISQDQSDDPANPGMGKVVVSVEWYVS